MKNKTVVGLVVCGVCASFTAGAANAAVLNGDEAFAGSLAPAALAQVELPKAAQAPIPSILPLPKDSFSYLSECRMIDTAVFIKQPSVAESVQLLAGCMKQVSGQYKVKVQADMLVAPFGGPGGGPQGAMPSGIIISVTGKIPAGNPIVDHLTYSLEKRNNHLFGHRVMLSAPRVKGVELTEKSSAGLLGPLRTAVKGAQRQELEEMGYIFGLETYPAKTQVKKILEDIIGYELEDVNAGAFHMSSGDAAVRSFVKYLRDEAASEDEQVISRNIRNVATEAEKVFLGTREFAGVQLAAHRRQEDGDMDYQVLIAQEKDGSFLVLQYMRNPY
ncbi:MAG: hypothetical protein NDI60_00895 [Elusimicrobiales bacterium]|nr:hypothetical protein [Elusimicrobiales bacterium]